MPSPLEFWSTLQKRYILYIGIFSALAAFQFSYGQTTIPTSAPAPILNDDDSVSDSWFREYHPQAALSLTTRAARDGIAEQDASITIPLGTNPGLDHLFTTSVAYNHRDDGSFNFSGGFGFGFLFTEFDAALRARIHGDVTDSANGHQLGQFGAGFDLYTGWGVDVIGNWYIPNSGANSIAQFQTTNFGNPFAQGNSVLQFQNDAVFNIFEQGYEGGDIKVKFDVPVLNSFVPTKAHVGGYHYDSNFLRGDELSGLFAGVSVSPLQGVGIGAEYYEDEEFYGNQWVFKTGVTIPLDGFGIKSLGKGLREAFSRRSDNSRPTGNAYLMAQLASNADRRNWVLTEISDPIQTSATTTTKTIADDLIFVNNNGAIGNGIQAGSAAGDGTAENPFQTIQAGANAVGGGIATVYVQETGTPYVETVTANGNAAPFAAGTEITFFSSFRPIQACGGMTFGGDTARTQLTGVTAGFNLSNLNSVTIDGFDVTSTAGSGISTTNNDNFVATNNIVTASGNGIVYFGSDGHAFTIANNTVNALANGQGALRMQSNNGTVTGTVDNNTTNGFQHGNFVFAATGGGPVINFTSFSNNTFNNSTLRGVFFRADAGNTINIDGFTGNTFNMAVGNSVRVQNAGTVTIEGGNNFSLNPGAQDYGLQSNTLSPVSLFQLTNENGNVLIVDDTTPTTDIP